MLLKRILKLICRGLWGKENYHTNQMKFLLFNICIKDIGNPWTKRISWNTNIFEMQITSHFNIKKKVESTDISIQENVWINSVYMKSKLKASKATCDIITYSSIINWDMKENFNNLMNKSNKYSLEVWVFVNKNVVFDRKHLD